MPITEASTKKLRLLCPWRSSSVQRRKKKFDKKMTVARGRPVLGCICRCCSLDFPTILRRCTSECWQLPWSHLAQPITTPSFELTSRTCNPTGLGPHTLPRIYPLTGSLACWLVSWPYLMWPVSCANTFSQILGSSPARQAPSPNFCGLACGGQQCSTFTSPIQDSPVGWCKRLIQIDLWGSPLETTRFLLR